MNNYIPSEAINEILMAVGVKPNYDLGYATNQYTDPNQRIIETINKYSDVRDRLNQQAIDILMQLDLVEREIYLNVASLVYVQYHWSKAIDYINNPKDNKDKKQYYDSINRLIVHDIIGDTECDYKKTKAVTGLIYTGYPASHYAVDIEFTVNNKKLSLYYPNPCNLSREDALYSPWYYQYRLCDRTKDHIISTIGKPSYILSDIQKTFKEYIENGEES